MPNCEMSWMTLLFAGHEPHRVCPGLGTLLIAFHRCDVRSKLRGRTRRLKIRVLTRNVVIDFADLSAICQETPGDLPDRHQRLPRIA
jgi:hypothetical protein